MGELRIEQQLTARAYGDRLRSRHASSKLIKWPVSIGRRRVSDRTLLLQSVAYPNIYEFPREMFYLASTRPLNHQLLVLSPYKFTFKRRNRQRYNNIAVNVNFSKHWSRTSSAMYSTNIMRTTCFQSKMTQTLKASKQKCSSIGLAISYIYIYICVYALLFQKISSNNNPGLHCKKSFQPFLITTFIIAILYFYDRFNGPR